MADPLEQAIVALLTGQNVIEANKFLLAFTDSDEAWLGSIRVIQNSTDYAARYFAANILYTKVRKHWSQLGETERNQIYAFLSETVICIGSAPDVGELHVNKKVRVCFSNTQ